ncbi:hypothetical protein BGX34_004671, partial [Mortierella sp. NVP85]
MSVQEPSVTTLEPEPTTETTEPLPPPTATATPSEPPLTTTDHEPHTTTAVSYSTTYPTNLPWTPTVTRTEAPSSAAPWTPTMHHTTPFTTHYITTVSVITITTLIPQTTVISGTVVTIYSTKVTTTRVPTVIPDPNQPPPASYIFTGEHGLKPWHISLIIVAALVLISACAAVFVVAWMRRRKKTGTRNKAEEERGDDILMPIGLEPWNDPATAAAVMGSPHSGRASGMWHEYDKEGAYDAAGAAMMSGSTIAGTSAVASTSAAAAAAAATTSPTLGGYPEFYFETTGEGAGGGGGSGYFYGHGQEFSDDYYDPGGHGYPLSSFHEPSHHGHYRHEPHELSRQPSFVHNGHPYSRTFDTLPASYQDGSTGSYPTFYPPPPPPPPPSIYVSRTTHLPSSVIGSPQATVFTMADDSLLSNKMTIEGMEMDKVANLSAITVGSGDASEESQQLERNAKVEMRRKSPQALLPVRQQPQAEGGMEEFSIEESSRCSRSSGEYMISGDEFGGHSKSQDKGKGKLVEDDEVSTSAVAGVISDRIGSRDEG